MTGVRPVPSHSIPWPSEAIQVLGFICFTLLPMDPTRLLYMEDMQRTEGDATVVAIEKEDDRNVVVLDRTWFHPQGGGQPWDQGTIEGNAGRFRVDEVRLVEGVVRHIGGFESGSFEPGQVVGMRVDRTRRSLNARLHSAGHVVDMAVSAQNLGWVPGKGYHFPQGPYVEYDASVDDLDLDALKREIEKAANGFVDVGIETSLRFMTRGELASVCHFVPDYVPEDRPSRVVFYGDFGVPCGGTHVANLRDIGPITIRKIKKAKGSAGTMRVSYELTNDK